MNESVVVRIGAAVPGDELPVPFNTDEDIGFTIDSGTNDFWMAYDNTDNAFHIGTSTTIGSSTVLTVLTTGYVGIGTTTPDEKLSVIGDIGIYNENELRLSEAATNGLNYAGFQASTTLDGNYVWTLPTTQGTTLWIRLVDCP